MENIFMGIATIAGIVIWVGIFKYIIIPIGRTLSKNPEMVEGGVRIIRRILKK